MTIHRLSAEEAESRGVEWLYLLEADYVYPWVEAGMARRIVVPAGFLYDAASVPRIAWSASGLTPAGPILAAATVHDFFYAYDGKLPEGAYQGMVAGVWTPVFRAWTRAEADAKFAEILKRTDLYAGWQVTAAYLAVRVGGRRW